VVQLNDLSRSLAAFDTASTGLAFGGRRRRKLRSVKFGRKPALTRYQREEALAQRANETLMDIAFLSTSVTQRYVGYRTSLYCEMEFDKSKQALNEW